MIINLLELLLYSHENEVYIFFSEKCYAEDVKYGNHVKSNLPNPHFARGRRGCMCVSVTPVSSNDINVMNKPSLPRK